MTTESSEKLFLRVPEAAERLSIGRSKLYELLAAGEIKRVKVGARVLIPVQELEDWARRLVEDADGDIA